MTMTWKKRGLVLALPLALVSSELAAQPDAPRVVVPPASSADPPNPLVPPGETERMAKRKVELSKIQFVPGKGLSLESADGDFKLVTGLRAQFLYSVEHVEEDEELVQSFSVRRGRLSFAGNAFGKNNKFKLQLGFSPRDLGTQNGAPTTSPLIDFYWDFTHFEPISVRVGQYKVPFNRQNLISSGAMQLVERSIVNSEFSLDRDIGVDLRTKDIGNFFRYALGVFIGEGRNSFSDNNFGMAYVARVEVLPLGMFDDLNEPDFERGKPRISVGMAYAFLDRANTNRGIRGSAPADGGTTDMQLATADISFKVAGFSFLSETIVRDGSRNPGDDVDDMGVLIPVEDSRDGWGAMMQVGYLVPRVPLEIAGRYGVIRGDEAGSLSDGNEAGGGASYYFLRHSLKLQADYFRLWGDDVGLGDDRVRVQLQAAF